MLTRKKSLSFSTKNGNAAARENNVPVIEEESQKCGINSLDYYLNEIIKTSNNPNSPDFRVAISSFQKFVFNKYNAEKISHNERTFLNELFQNISINREIRTTFQYAIFTKAIVSVDIGDKMIIATYLSNTINCIKPDTNKLTWVNLGYVLEFLKKSLKNGVYLIISNLKYLSYEWIQDKAKMDSGFYLLGLLLKKFHSFLEPYFSQIQAMIISGLTEGGGPEAVFEAIDIVINLQKNKVNFNLLHFCNSLVIFLNIVDKKIVKNIMQALNTILDNFPEYSINLSLAINPIDLLKDTKNGDNVLTGLQIAPFYVRTLKVNSETNDSVNQLIDLYYNLLFHRSQCRSEALISLADAIFAAKIKGFVIVPDLLSKLFQKLTKYFDIDQIYYTYIALMTMRDASSFDNDCKLILNINRPLNQFILDGFYNYCKIAEMSPFNQAQNVKLKIDRIFLVYFNNIILNQSPTDRIIFVLEGILKLDISMDLIHIPLAIKYSLLMNHNDYEVRKLTTRFIIKYQQKKPTLEMLCRILIIIGTELTPLRNDLYHELNRQPEDPSLIPLLVSLLHDSSNYIQKCSLQYLVELIHIEGVPNIITDFLSDISETMKLTNGVLPKTSLRFFEIVCEAYKNTKNEVFRSILIPFADFLIDHILQSEILPHIGLTILSYMIPISLKETINQIDLDKLVMHIEQSLVPHSSQRRLESTFDLLLASLSKTDLRFTIYDKHSNILSRLQVICGVNKSNVNQMKLLYTISTIGAINPEFMKTQLNSIFENEETSDVIVNTPMYFLSISQSDKINDKLISAATGIAIKTLLEMMNEKVLSTLFSASIEALEKIIKSGSVISDLLLKEVFNHISIILENDDNPSDVPKMISALQAMVAFLREKIGPLIPRIVDYIYSNWNKFDHSLLIKIVEFIPIRCGHELLKPYIFKLASLFVADLNNCPIQMADDIYSVFDSLSIYVPIIGSVIYPPLITWINNHAYNTKACIPMIQKLSSLLASKKGGKEYSAQIIRTMIKIVQVNKELHNTALSVIRVLAELIGPRFILYLPSLQSTFTITQTDELASLIATYKLGEINTQIERGTKVRTDSQPKKVSHSEIYREASLSASSFDAHKPPSDTNDENQWLLWWDKVSASFFDNCPCRSVKTCKEIAKRYTLMKDKLFPIAFCICRITNLQKYQWLDEWLKTVITTAPSSISRTFLSIIEIYEVLEIKVMKLNPRIVAKKAMETDSYALAIHIYETIFESERRVSEDTTKSLITLNQQLGFADAANGILKVSNTQGQSELSEKLGLWDEALNQYLNESKGIENTGQNIDFVSVCSKMDIRSTLGVMNCLSHLSRFAELINVANSILKNPAYSNQSEMRINSLRHAAFASWYLFDYQNFDKYANDFINESNVVIKNDENDNSDEIGEKDYIIVMANILKRNFEGAKNKINEIRLNSCNKLFPLIGENYELIYEESSIITGLSEAEEVIQYLEQGEIAKSPEKTVREEAYSSMNRIKKLWKLRYSSLRPICSVLHRHLCIRSIVLPISEQRDEFLSLINASIEQKRLELAESVLQHCESKDPKCEKYRTMRCKLIWARGDKKKAIDSLSTLELTKETNLILSQWLFEYGDLQKARLQLEKEMTKINDQDKESLQLYNSNLAFSEWEVWANINLELFKSNPNQINYVIDSLEGLMNALSVAKSHSILTFTLRILHLLFNHKCNELFDKFEEMLQSGKISLSVWPDVVIQLMSRLASSNLGLRKTIGDLITTVGLMHPHSVLLSLMVMTYFENTEKQRISREIINKIKQKHPFVVSSLSRFSFELQKVALSWWEATVSKIDEVSHIYANNITVDSILSKGNGLTNAIKDQISPQCHYYLSEICKGLERLDNMVLCQPYSFYEISYSNEFGHTMEVASHWRKVYEKTKDIAAFQVSWNYYTNVFYAIRPLLSNFNNFQLTDFSPYLSNFTSKTAQIPVPGTYSVSMESKPILIESFSHEVVIIDSKQRPRRIDLFGDDGNKYTFLLKAHEDTRLDERIMQFFSFINTCILDKRKSNNLTDNFRNRLTITTYKVSPLTPEVGMIGFVKNCMTLFDLVKNYRTKKSIKVEAEYNLIISKLEKYDDLPLCDEKIRYFRFGYEACDGNDIKKVLFNSSDDSMDWLQRRTTYTASLAMTSMAGYVLGLGDRHLCNIMINKRTGKLVHIDFGDSFEVAQLRPNFPEKVPFRLTRLLQNALEVSRIEGTFRKSCENTLGMMRTNSEQIIGLLSAFIYDPLRQWTETTKQLKDEINPTQLSINELEEEKVINRITAKLCGNDFNDKMNLNVEEQVERLINDATDVKNLCMMYKGWYPWW